jgi:CBS domain containing-hemolysin-like protein
MPADLLPDLLGLLAVVLLILLNGFFVAAEFAIVRIRHTRVEELVARGDRRAPWIQRALRETGRFIATTQLGITTVGLALGWLAEPVIARLFEPLLNLLPVRWQSGVAYGVSASLAFALTTFLLVVFGELAPKALALQNPERIARLVARPILAAASVLRPITWLLNLTGLKLARSLGVRSASEQELAHSVEELKMLVSASAESGVVQGDEEEMVHAVLDFGDTLVRQVMVPRTEMVAVPADASLDSVLQTLTEQPVTKLPVYEVDPDHVIGVVHLQDVLPAWRRPDAASQTARDLMRETLFVPDTVRISDLLRRFRSRRQHLAIVLDEYGGTAGLVTLEDLLEEIVGEIQDEYDWEERPVEKLRDGSLVVDGTVPAAELRDSYEVPIPESTEFETVAGYMLDALGSMPKGGEVVTVGDYRLTVVDVERNRISKVKIEKAPPASGA